MMPTGVRTRRAALLVGKVLAFILLAVSSRALLAPNEAVTKAAESRRPKSPKNVVRAEPLRVSEAGKQGQTPILPHPKAVAQDLDAGLARSSRIPTLPRKAYTQLTKPEYLKSDSPGSPHIPLSPPA